MARGGNQEHPGRRSLGAVLLVLLTATGSSTATPSPPDGARTSPLGHEWLDPDGRTIPWHDPVEIETFLAEARVVADEPLPTGSTGPHRLLLEQGNIRAHAIFRTVDVRDLRRELEDGSAVLHFRDRAIHEAAAYALSGLLGLDTVPPAVVRRVDGKLGTLQLWVEGAMTVLDRRERGFDPPRVEAYRRQFADMHVFDALIHNIDRTQENAILDADWRLWYIDHTRSFLPLPELVRPEALRTISAPLWERLQTIDEDQIRERLSPLLPRPEIRALLERRERLVAFFAERIRTEGRPAVVVGVEPAGTAPERP